MDLKSEILKEHSKNQALKIVSYINNDPEKFDELMVLFLSDNFRITQRSAMVLNLCVSNSPEIIKPYLKGILENLNNDVHAAVIRNTFRLLQFIEIPDDLCGLAVEQCFKHLQSQKTPVAIQVFALTVLANIAKHEADLSREIIYIIEDKIPYSSPAFRSRGAKILKALKKQRA